jgi:hypothetical protein
MIFAWERRRLGGLNVAEPEQNANLAYIVWKWRLP